MFTKISSFVKQLFIKEPKKPKEIDWQVDFGPVFGKAGSITTITVYPQCTFKTTHMFATDSYYFAKAKQIKKQIKTKTRTKRLKVVSPTEDSSIQDQDEVDFGYSTRIGDITIGIHQQRPASAFTLTAFFASNSLGNGIKLATCEEYHNIGLQVSFIRDCTFDATLFGSAIL